MSDNKYITFIDNAGRSIFGTKAAETKTTLTVENPVMIHVAQQEGGQMSVQLFPLFFAEFVDPDANGSRSNKFTYHKNNIAVGKDFNVDPRIIQQYERIANPVLVPNDQSESREEDPDVVKLFDD